MFTKQLQPGSSTFPAIFSTFLQSFSQVNKPYLTLYFMFNSTLALGAQFPRNFEWIQGVFSQKNGFEIYVVKPALSSVFMFFSW